METALRILENWRRVGVARDDVDELPDVAAALDRLEVERGVRLPAAFRALWSRSDGTAAADDDGITFWPLDNVAHDPSLGRTSHLVVADVRLGSIVYALRFEHGVARGVDAFVDGAGEPREVAPSFEVFLARYLDDPRSLVTR